MTMRVNLLLLIAGIACATTAAGIVCPAGTSSPTGSSPCVKCKPGTYAPVRKSTSCTPCWTGSTAPTAGAKKCISNLCGQTFLDAVSTCSRATPCPAGVDSQCPQGQFCFARVPCATQPAAIPSVCDKCNLAVSQGGCKCDANCNCLPAGCPVGAWRCPVPPFYVYNVTNCVKSLFSASVFASYGNPAFTEDTADCAALAALTKGPDVGCAPGYVQSGSPIVPPGVQGFECTRIPSVCDKCNLAVAQGGCKCDANCNCLAGTAAPAPCGTACYKCRHCTCNADCACLKPVLSLAGCAAINAVYDVVSSQCVCKAGYRYVPEIETCWSMCTSASCATGQGGEIQCFAGPYLTAPPVTPAGGGVSKYIASPAAFDNIFKHRADPGCVGAFYTYQSLLTAAAAFPAFAAASDDATNKRELAAFLGQISHETTGGWPTAPDGPYAWGLCFIREGGVGPKPVAPAYCDPFNAQYPCAAGKVYYGRGPMQLSWNYNYGPAGAALNADLLNNPDLVETDPVLAFKTAIYFWMTAADNKPSCHDVMIGAWTPSAADVAANRLPGYGTVTNIINGGLECGQGSVKPQEQDRVGFFQRYAAELGVTTGANLLCSNSQHF